MIANTSPFDLPDRLAAKADPALISHDVRHFAAIAENLERAIADLDTRLDAVRRQPGGAGQHALERDLEVHRLTARLRALRRFGLDLCLGHLVPEDGARPVYIGRLGLTDAEGSHLLLDWRSPAAEPFFGATHARPMGLVSRRRYRWTSGRITDYWDEVFTTEGLRGHSASLDDQSAFIASLGTDRSDRMRDVLGTIAADQDAIIRAGSRGALVVDGGPGTGKTVVALHRAAYLLYSDPRLSRSRGGVLFVGPHQPYLNYVSDVLPGLGEEGVELCTLGDLVPESANAIPETDDESAALKGSARWVGAIAAAVRTYERPPAMSVTVETPWADVRVAPGQWQEAFAAAEPGTPHNDAREPVWDALLEILLDALLGEREDEDEDNDEFDAYGLNRDDNRAKVRRALATDADLLASFDRVWPLLDAPALVGRLWSDPVFLQGCAPWLDPAAVSTLQHSGASAWTTADVPLLDIARQLLGDPRASRERRRREAAVAAERERMSEVLDQLIASDDSELRIMSMLRGQDLRSTLLDEAALPATDRNVLVGPFAHIIVDEAQELTDAQWQMLLLRCPSRSFTIVGDRAQARHGFTESWDERLERIGLHETTVASLGINYRTPREVMAEAEPVIRAVLPDANVPTSIRSAGTPVLHAPASQLLPVLDDWAASHPEGIACVIGDAAFEATPRVRSLTPQLAKGLEFDLVVLVDPQRFGAGITGAVDRYVAMTRATQRLVILTGP